MFDAVAAQSKPELIDDTWIAWRMVSNTANARDVIAGLVAVGVGERDVLL